MSNPQLSEMQVHSLEVQSLRTRLKELEMALTQAEEQVRSWPETARQCVIYQCPGKFCWSTAGSEGWWGSESGPGPAAKGRGQGGGGGAADSADGGAEEESAAGGDSETSGPAEQLPDQHEAGESLLLVGLLLH